uniref:SLC41A/MgtE integral membrane domain-containing protein n=1 Tax=Setaria digitata TaxID=48799 RepID=A0A915PRC0_9BILA
MSKTNERIPMAQKTLQSQSIPSESIQSTSDPRLQVIRGRESARERVILISVLKQTLLPFFVAGLGQICTGLFFEQAQHWWYFLYVPEAFVLVPALLGLKGNLEVTYASRFCTLSNAGQTKTMEEICVIARFNLCLIELQAIILSFLAALLSSGISLINCDFNRSHFMVTVLSGVYTATLSSFVIGFIMIGIVVSTRRYGIDPDNITAPLTATLSDFITLIMLIGVGMLVVTMYIYKLYILSITIMMLLFCCTPFLIYYTTREPHTRAILKDSWLAVVAAIIVGCCSGLLLQSAIIVFPGIAALHPLIAGLAGNRVSVQSSRLSTALHLSECSLGRLPAGTTIWTFLNPSRFFCLRHLDSKVAFLLLVTAIPYNFIFVIVVIFTAKNINFSWILVGTYIVTTFVQVTVYAFWWLRMDPDNSSVPVLTSLGDLLGIGLLYVLFTFLHHFSPTTVQYQRYQTMNTTRQCGISF